MALSKELFMAMLDAHIENKHLLKSPFYSAWSKGLLTKECLQEYAKDYYYHVKAFPRYISAIHHRAEDDKTRKALLQNLWDEEGEVPSHPDLWRDFALCLGNTSDEIDNHQPRKEVRDLVNTFNDICREEPIAAAIAALYAYESQIPAICISKIEGLKEHYGLTNPKDWRYFSIHIAADEEHASVERALIEKHLNEENSSRTLQAVEKILDSLWDFLTALHDKHCTAMSC